MNVDEKTISRIQLLHPRVRLEVQDMYEEICKALTYTTYCRFTHTLRTFAEQDKLYAQGRTELGSIVTNARGGKSYHNYGLAIDMVLIDGLHTSWEVDKDFDGDGKADWMEVVTIFKQYGWEWGGDWKFSDKPHFQKTFGYSIVELKRLYDVRRVDKNNFVLI